jgi:hypothetical protein
MESKMRSIIGIGSVLIVLVPAVIVGTNAFAQDAQTATPLPVQIKQKLQSAGYSDVNVMPTSFVVQAKDKQGDPVEILITPHSMMEVTALNASEQNNLASSGSSDSTSGNK